LRILFRPKDEFGPYSFVGILFPNCESEFFSEL
jgi:hypothetical protein